MLSDLDEDSSSKKWCARPSRVQNRLTVLHEISGVPSSRECRFRAKETSLINGGYAFFDEIPLNFPKPQRRKQETVCWFKLGGFVLVPHSTRRCLGTLARFLRVPVWTSTFSNVSALVVPLSSTVLPSRDSFPSHPWFAPRCNTGCDRLVAVTRAPTFEIRDALRCGVRSIVSARPQSRQILGVECLQGRCNGSPNPYNSFFDAWAEQRDPQLSANKQSRPAHR
jgi:hypothetical protein